jgi:iron(III) transport system substrate-binding protein
MKARCWSRVVTALLLGVLLGACAAPASGPARPNAGAPAPANPAPAASAPPAGSPATAAAPAEWDRVLEAARKEGRVAVYGPRGDTARVALTGPFQEQYGIQVDYLSLPPPELAARLLTERRAGVYEADVFLSGTGSMVMQLQPEGSFDPLEPGLLRSEVKDPARWLNGHTFTDPERQVYEFAATLNGMAAYNPQLVPPGSIASIRDLLDPKYRGQIVILDPLQPGTGQGLFTSLYHNPMLGKEFIEKLAAQNPVIQRDARQALEWVARGRHLVNLGPDRILYPAMKAEGAPLDGVQLPDGLYLTAATGAIGLVNRAPHPNAAKVYLNWFLGPEAQERYNAIAGQASRRLDVTNEHVGEEWVPKPGVAYTRADDLTALQSRDELVQYLRPLFGR